MARHPQEKLPYKPQVEFTAERKLRFLEKFRETGFQVISAEYAGVADRTVRYAMVSDPEFAEAYREAKDYHTESVIEATMIKRAVEGVSEPLIGGQFKDQIITHVQKYSDACLLALARSRKAEYNKGAGEDGPGGASGGGGRGGGVLVVPAAPHTIVEWETLFGEKARGTTGRGEE